MPPEFFILALVLDLAIGDPRVMPHPVEAIGAAVSWLGNRLNGAVEGAGAKRIAGASMVLVVAGLAFVVSYALIALAYMLLGQIGGAAVTVFFAYTTISVRGLAAAAMAVAGPLRNGDLKTARGALAMIVGRDTGNLDSPDIARGAVESVAENASDGVVAPIFYLALGGVPLAMTYKAINTMDSMVGYKTDELIDFGRAAARLDDAANFIPARLTAFFIVAASALLGLVYRGSYSAGRAWTILNRDGANHPSPNSGRPEAAVAGALGVRLGGASSYFGRKSVKPYIGDPVNELGPEKVVDAVRLMYAASVLSLVFCAWFSHILYHIRP